MTDADPRDGGKVEYSVTRTDRELQEILDLQTGNRPEHLTGEELRSQGFVTARHDLEVLRRMHQEYPHVIAKVGKNKGGIGGGIGGEERREEHVIGYALCMMKSAERLVPTLAGLFQNIENGTTRYRGKVLTNQSIHRPDTNEYKNDNDDDDDDDEDRDCHSFKYFVMGQVCIHKNYRGKGIFDGLYRHMRRVMASNFHGVVTSISTRNQRSLRAHARVGFSTIHEYSTGEGDDWKLVLWDWTTTP